MFKVWLKTAGDENCSKNDLIHDTVDDAVAYAKDLHSRWMLVTDWFVVPEDSGLEGHPSESVVLVHAVHRMSGVIEGKR